jgi:Leucine-rich repeat (LRR) protein
MQTLPHDLLTLDLCGIRLKNDDNDCKQFPKNLTSLRLLYCGISFNNSRDIGNLPRTLQHLMLPHNYHYQNGMFEQLPPGLLTLQFKSSESPVQSPREHFPTTLLSLDLSFNTRSHVDMSGLNLPPSLQTLKTNLHIHDRHLVKFPPTLTYVDAPNAIITDDGVPYLPQCLEYLSVTYIPVEIETYKRTSTMRPFGISDNGLSSLPQGLKHLSLGTSLVTALGVKNLPPQLSTLYLNWCSKQDFPLDFYKSLPRSITSLHVSNFILSDKVIRALAPLRQIQCDKVSVVLYTSPEIVLDFLTQLNETYRKQILETMQKSDSYIVKDVLTNLPWI